VKLEDEGCVIMASAMLRSDSAAAERLVGDKGPRVTPPAPPAAEAEWLGETGRGAESEEPARGDKADAAVGLGETGRGDDGRAAVAAAGRWILGSWATDAAAVAFEVILALVVPTGGSATLVAI
jgi:hypothetical protein